jgi:hypothetical protein
MLYIRTTVIPLVPQSLRETGLFSALRHMNICISGRYLNVHLLFKIPLARNWICTIGALLYHWILTNCNQWPRSVIMTVLADLPLVWIIHSGFDIKNAAAGLESWDVWLKEGKKKRVQLAGKYFRCWGHDWLACHARWGFLKSDSISLIISLYIYVIIQWEEPFLVG